MLRGTKWNRVAILHCACERSGKGSGSLYLFLNPVFADNCGVYMGCCIGPYNTVLIEFWCLKSTIMTWFNTFFLLGVNTGNLQLLLLYNFVIKRRFPFFGEKKFQKMPTKLAFWTTFLDKRDKRAKKRKNYSRLIQNRLKQNFKKF